MKLSDDTKMNLLGYSVIILGIAGFFLFSYVFYFSAEYAAIEFLRKGKEEAERVGFLSACIGTILYFYCIYKIFK